MNVISEAMRWMDQPEPPSSEGLREQIINTILWAESDGGSYEIEPVVAGLVASYEAALALESEVESDGDEQRELPPLDGDAAWQLMLRVYVKTVCYVVKGYDAEMAAEGFNWPDGLRYQSGHGYERRLVTALGVALGYHDGQRTRQWFDYCRAEDAREAANG